MSMRSDRIFDMHLNFLIYDLNNIYSFLQTTLLIFN